MPLKSYTPIVPEMIRVKKKSTKMFSMEGNEFSKVSTSPRMPCKELSVRRGRKILMTLMAETFNDDADSENHPKITTEKSSIFHGSLK